MVKEKRKLVKKSVSRRYSVIPRRKQRIRDDQDKDRYVRSSVYLDRDLVDVLDIFRFEFGVGMTRSDLVRLILSDAVSGKFRVLYDKVKSGELKVARDLWNDTFAFMDHEQYKKHFSK